jgi:hypothetical protein
MPPCRKTQLIDKVEAIRVCSGGDRPPAFPRGSYCSGKRRPLVPGRRAGGPPLGRHLPTDMNRGVGSEAAPGEAGGSPGGAGREAPRLQLVVRRPPSMGASAGRAWAASTEWLFLNWFGWPRVTTWASGRFGEPPAFHGGRAAFRPPDAERDAGGGASAPNRVLTRHG